MASRHRPPLLFLVHSSMKPRRLTFAFLLPLTDDKLREPLRELVLAEGLRKGVLVSPAFLAGAKWVSNNRPELLPFIPLVHFEGASLGRAFTLKDLAAAKGTRVRLAKRAECIRNVILHWTSRLPEIAMHRTFSFDDAQRVIDGDLSPNTLRDLIRISPLLMSLVDFGRREQLDLGPIISTSLRLAKAACKDTALDRAYVPSEDVSEQKFFLQVRPQSQVSDILYGTGP